VKETINDFKDINGISIKIGDVLKTRSNDYVKVVRTDDFETGFGFDLEDSDGYRLYNPYFAVENMCIVDYVNGGKG
jgi:hypothetical protein